MPQPDLHAMHQAVVDGDAAAARRLAEELVASGAELLPAVEAGFIAGIRRVGELWDEGEYFLPELVQGAEAMKAAMAVVHPVLAAAGQARAARGRVVLGTVEGDLHDIGKSLVGVLLAANGFEVHDLGASVPVAAFLATAAAVDADIVAASALLTTTMQVQASLAEAVASSPEHRHRRVLLGGAPTTRRWAEGLGATHAENAVHAVEVARELLE